VPVLYPTPEQAKLGSTGSDVGVHGPHRAFLWLRHATVLSDWTAGCIAVGTDAEVQSIAKWIDSVRPSAITIV
jgi:hypothetical protein